MSYLDNKEPPKREERLKTCIAYGGTICGIEKQTKGCCLTDVDRGFTQGSICLLLPGLAMLNSLPDNVVLLHGAIGCGACSHSQNANVRSGNNIRNGKVKDALWLSTALNEGDVINGGETKLKNAIVEADKRYRPATITVVTGCVPGIIGDDIDGVIDQIQPHVAARLIPVHCEGFKTKIWATAYDAVYHGIGRTLLDDPEDLEDDNIIRDELKDLKDKYKISKTINLFNVSSMGRGDEIELSRLLASLGFETNVFPVFTKPEEMYKVKYAALSISTCPTHDDYFLKFLKEKYNIPYILKHMPIGIENTNSWVRDVSKYFKLEEIGEKIISEELKSLNEALKEMRAFFKGKKVFVCAGEFRALATANLLHELGFDIVGIRAFHHDEFAEVEYEKLVKFAGKDYSFSVADVQPFEEANILKKLKPDVFLGHWNGNGTASKLGIATHVIYNTGLNYIGYKGAYELARRLYRQLKNPAFNKKISKYVSLPYKKEWYDENPYKYIKTAGGDSNE